MSTRDVPVSFSRTSGHGAEQPSPRATRIRPTSANWTVIMVENADGPGVPSVTCSPPMPEAKARASVSTMLSAAGAAAEVQQDWKAGLTPDDIVSTGTFLWAMAPLEGRNPAEVTAEWFADFRERRRRGRPTLTGAALQVMREGLGLSHAHLFALLNADTSGGRIAVLDSLVQWESGKYSVPGWVARAMLALAAQRREHVRAAATGPVYTVPRSAHEGLPASYWRLVGWAALELNPGLRIE